jgi:hypothetical protein
VRDDVCVTAEVCIPAGVVAMKMGVQHELQPARIQLLQGRFDLVRQWRELIIHNQQAFRPGRHADVPARALQHVDIFGDMDGLDFNFGKILLSTSGRCERKENCGEESLRFHGWDLAVF